MMHTMVPQHSMARAPKPMPHMQATQGIQGEFHKHFSS